MASSAPFHPAATIIQKGSNSMVGEKTSLLQGEHERFNELNPIPSPRSSRFTRSPLLLASFVSLAALFSLSYFQSPLISWTPSQPLSASAQCPVQPAALSNGPDWTFDAEFTEVALNRLKGAVRIPTQSYDDMGKPGEDPRYEIFKDLSAYLNETFPLVHDELQLDLVSEYARLYTWKGSDMTLKPVLLMAHQDVVPVNPDTENQWTYPPFSAHQDEEGWIWGRGTCDCKNTLIASLTAVEQLVAEGFKPTRTILLSFGVDEEISGKRSAHPLATLIESRYRANGISIIVDEGFTGISTEFNQEFARFGMAEKGALSVSLSVLTPGGHSSVPLRHTGIGILARLLVELEDNPFEVKLEGNPMLSYLNCAADFAEVGKELKKQIKDPKAWGALGEHLAEDPVLRAFLGTTQAIDLINGGVKINALPELATAKVNYRIDFQSSVAATFDHIKTVLEPVVAGFNLTFDVSGSHADVANSVVRLDVVKGSLIEPAPITPAKGDAWELIGGTVKHLWPEAILAPSAMIANTDTKWTWGLTDKIYRFTPGRMELFKNFHTVNERIHLDAHLSTIKFYHAFLRNTQIWQGE